MKVVQINTFSYKAAGNIMMNLHKAMLEKGIDSYVAWGRGRNAENDHEYYMNDGIGVKVHGVYTRITDKHGFKSDSSTKKLLKWIDSIDPVGIVYKAEDDEPDDKEKCEVANAVYSAFDKARFCPAEKDGKVSYEVLKKWVEELKGLLIKQKQENLFGHLIGRLLAYSPIGADSYQPCEAVRKIIEEYDSDSLRSSYIVAEENKRGVHTVDAGKSELILHQRYLNNAEGLQAEYPKTAEIYFTLSEDYKREAEYERKRAEDEW